ncbi:MAG: hypothetical protein IPK89_15770 [Sphingomonadales bacterium]|nr:hypothetical protein [Sphingomonadales bacterium]
MLGAAFSRIMHGAVILYNVRVSRLLEGREDAAKSSTTTSHHSAPGQTRSRQQMSIC